LAFATFLKTNFRNITPKNLPLRFLLYRSAWGCISMRFAAARQHNNPQIGQKTQKKRHDMDAKPIFVLRRAE
jgi:hypothetical protein